TLPEALNRLSDPDGARRRRAAQALARSLQAATPGLALALNTLAFEEQVDDRWRNYPTPAAARHLANEAPAAAVEALEAAGVGASGSACHGYHRRKAPIVGREALDEWDRDAPLTAAQPRVYGWDEPKAVVLGSFAALASKFGEPAA